MAPDNTIGSRPRAVYPSAYRYGEVSLRHLREGHPDLVVLACEALLSSQVDFGVHDCGRTHEEQRELYKLGLTRTLDSRHIVRPRHDGGNGYSHAIDVHPSLKVAGKTRWDFPAFNPIADAFEEASRRTGIPYAWGGRWKRFVDGPHFELPRDLYPPDKEVTQAQIDRAAAAVLKVRAASLGQT